MSAHRSNVPTVPMPDYRAFRGKCKSCSGSGQLELGERKKLKEFRSGKGQDHQSGCLEKTGPPEGSAIGCMTSVWRKGTRSMARRPTIIQMSELFWTKFRRYAYPRQYCDEADDCRQYCDQDGHGTEGRAAISRFRFIIISRSGRCADR